MTWSSFILKSSLLGEVDLEKAHITTKHVGVSVGGATCSVNQSKVGMQGGDAVVSSLAAMMVQFRCEGDDVGDDVAGR